MNGLVLENVDSFPYLGRGITNNNNDTEAVQKLISKGWNTYNNVKAAFTERKRPKSTKKKTLETHSTVPYVWCRNNNMEKRFT